MLEVSFAKAGCDQEEFQAKAAQRSEVCGWGWNSEMCRVGIFIPVKALSAATAGVTHLSASGASQLRETGTSISAPSLLKGWSCATRRGPSGTQSAPSHGEQEQGLVPAAGGCWISPLGVQTDLDPSLLAPPSPYTVPMVSGRWSKRYQLGSISQLSSANPVFLNFSFPLLKSCLLLLLFHVLCSLRAGLWLGYSGTD